VTLFPVAEVFVSNAFHVRAMSSGGGSGLPGMTRIVADIAVSLGGFVTGPGNGLGIGGEAPHTWAFPTTPATGGSCARRPPARAPSSSAAGSST
jgi:hypothetical protein